METLPREQFNVRVAHDRGGGVFCDTQQASVKARNPQCVGMCCDSVEMHTRRSGVGRSDRQVWPLQAAVLL